MNRIWSVRGGSAEGAGKPKGIQWDDNSPSSYSYDTGWEGIASAREHRKIALKSELEEELLFSEYLLRSKSESILPMKGPYLYLALSLAFLTKIPNLPTFSVVILVLIFVVSLIWSICSAVSWITRKATTKRLIGQRNNAAQNMRSSSPPPIRQGGPPPLPRNPKI